MEENRKLKEQLQLFETQKEADKNALITMKEMLEAYTEHKLQLTTQVSELEKQRKIDREKIEKLNIENESLKRQLDRLTEDNDSLLIDIENMEKQLQQVSGLGKEQKQNLVRLEEEINRLRENGENNKELITRNADLTKSLEELKEKYSFVKEINSEQRQKFNALKDRFIDVHKKLKKLKECKRILLETQHEYADSVSQWQMEIIKASKLLCKELDSLREENTQLLSKLGQSSQRAVEPLLEKINNLVQLTEKVQIDYNHLMNENSRLKQQMSSAATMTTNSKGLYITQEKVTELLQLSKHAFEEYHSLQLKSNDIQMASKQNVDEVPLSTIVPQLEALQRLANNALQEYQQQAKELTQLQNDYTVLKTKSADNVNMDTQNVNSTSTQQSFEDLQTDYHQLETKCRMYETKIEMLEKLEKDFEQICMENTKLQKDIEEITSSSQKNSEHLVELKKQVETSEKSSEDYHQMYKQKEREHYELLDEMRELNEALKARGDLISRQQEEQQSLKTELKQNVEKLQKIQMDIDKRDQELNEKQRQLDAISKTHDESKQQIEILESNNNLNEEKIRVLSTELEILKSSQQTSADLDNQSEILSTSTISRADELQRLKDVEDSFEEKYNKLRGLAAKLKKKLQDELSIKQELEKELRDLKVRENETKSKLNNLEATIRDMDLLKGQLSENQKQIETLKVENQKLKSSRKQANVLNLEIEAAEKSLTEVTNKLANLTSELDSAQELIRTKDATITQLRKEIELLEASKAAETKHSLDLKDQIDNLQKTNLQVIHEKQQAMVKTKTLEQDVENLKLELESARVELSNATCNLEKSLSDLKAEKTELSTQLSQTQLALSECEQKLKYTERATEDLRVEFLDYKIKAQAVLRKNQNRDSSKEKEQEEELLALRSTETQLKTTVESLKGKLQIVEKEKEQLIEDNNKTRQRSVELIQLVVEMRAQNDAINLELQQHIQQQHESLKQHRQQIETMDECHKDQIKSLYANHQRQMEQLRKELSVNVRLPPIVGAAAKTAASLHHIDHQQQSHMGEQSKLDYLFMEREDAEGSEEAAETLATLAASRKISNDSSSMATKRSHDFMPLDELLNTPINAISSETLITTPLHIPDNLNNNTDMLQLELNTTKERLQKQESRVRHLTSLLAENEQDLAKLTQMNDMLKEELRRQERSAEREQHLHNSEYVKNVIMKVRYTNYFVSTPN